jgi:hypothetical protein
MPSACGWRSEIRGDDEVWRPLGERIDFIDGDDICLDSLAARRVAQQVANAAGDPLLIQDPTLRNRLHERRYLRSRDEKRQRYTLRRTVAGARIEVLHPARSLVIEPSVDTTAPVLAFTRGSGLCPPTARRSCESSDRF